jgi:hypothetical protein
MRKGYSNIRTVVKDCPYTLNIIRDKKLLRTADLMLPRTTGIEIECRTEDTYALENELKTVKGITTANVSYSEVDFSFVAGHKGFIALYNALELIKKHCNINPASGIHYHIGVNDLKLSNILNYFSITYTRNLDWVLTKLESWGYKGNFNKKEVSFNKQWVKLHSDYDTIEYRIGGMTFDYKKIIAKVLHAQQLTTKMEDDIVATCLAEYVTDYGLSSNRLHKVLNRNYNEGAIFKNLYEGKQVTLLREYLKKSPSFENFVEYLEKAVKVSPVILKDKQIIDYIKTVKTKIL